MMLENSQEFLTFAIWISKTSESNTFNSYISDEFTRAFEYAKGRNYVYGRIYHYLNLLQEFIKHELNLNKSYHHHVQQRSLQSTSSRTKVIIITSYSDRIIEVINRFLTNHTYLN